MVKRSKTRQRAIFSSPAGVRSTPELDRLVQETVGRVADKWTLLVLEVLGQHEVLRFGQLAERVMRIRAMREKRAP
jgi:DNA-binding HxlR family transcriptional regulator